VSRSTRSDSIYARVQMCNESDKYQQLVQSLARPIKEGSWENIGHNVHVQGDVRRITPSQSVKAGAVE